MPPKRLPKLDIPLEDHYVGRLSYRGSGRLTKLKKKFEEYGLLDRAKESIFGQFFNAPEFTFSGAMVHTILLRRIKSLQEDELHFLIGSTPCKFGVHEFALVTGLNCSCPPLAIELQPHLTSSRIIETYFNVQSNKYIKFLMLERAFTMCDQVEDLWKLGLVYFVEGVLMATENEGFIWRDSLLMVEELDYFYKYPWGSLSFDQTMKQLGRDMKATGASIPVKKVKKTREGESVKRVQVESKYTCRGYPPSLQYWAYEAIVDLANTYAKPCGVKFPRMLQWESIGQPKHLDVKDILGKKRVACIPFLRPRPDERQFFETIYVRTEMDAPRYAMLKDMIQPAPEEGRAFDAAAEAAAVAEIAKQAGIFVEAEETEGAPNTTAQPDAAFARVSFEAVVAEMVTIKVAMNEIKATQETVLQNQQFIMDKLNALSHIPTDSKVVEYDIVPTCYEPPV
ncbi:uncharacterized protein LOC133789317 [Humulus lupulus]|uniref:uncharacterized protein LOC133789317 n=1 Tax=Humulus lupulus TaxID=3486 RepID=UPI002B404F4E|nr:uncharacterized protein LOC133789317 [Humulus lupulus]XP_062083122.1 uncharacterized protein LOC133789317 [Humulus lupulus]XP_062083123.1 uncharacterized protein LOC133789317 [Humulus lupulus]XP_062083124.1 uncharacterized protein LOC133789317 [Humulus lupulus]XP_062083125.1 uncharacterized protein LOC133789317 [Humulus lupulus]XP_062083126.1 uncharacterized protein LOC133789317 [Humulus lupulus]XP_062083127.1 uncharacterized protein LOC133789317 [Humulus lupulus]XP_062083129.1 uncharacte